MSLKTPAIPEPTARNLVEAVSALKEAVEVTKGRRGQAKPIATLASTATLAEVIAKVNELISRLQA
jgi:hypothetical protein